MTCYVLDITGFVDNNNAVVAKELALMPISYNGVPTTWFFKPPYEWNQLNEEAKSYNKYLIYRDGLKWESGEIDYDCVKKVLDKQLKDAKIIFIKDFKVGEWLVSNGFHNFYDEENSGWTLHSIVHLAIHINKYNPARASSYIPLPKSIQDKKACLNVQNFDDCCFKWAILSALHKEIKKNKHRIEPYKKFENELNFSGIESPVKIKDIPKFEKINKISVNVYALKQTGDIEPIHLTALKQEKHIHLLLIQDRYDDEDFQGEEPYIPIKYHYIWIKNLSRLVGSKLSKEKRKKYICDRCLHYFASLERLRIHEIDCATMNKCRIKLPEEKDKILKFKDYSKKEWVPFVIYGDFECVLKPINESKTYTEHEPLSVGFYLKCNFNPELSEYRCYRKSNNDDKSPSEWFVENLQNVADKVLEFFDNPKDMIFTDIEKLAYDKAEICHICKDGFDDERNIKVRDHDHITGEFRGAAHSKCNINYKDKRFVPVIFHNLSGYDSHLFIREVALGFPGRVSVLPQTKERYISFVKFMEDRKFSFRFIDSFKFMASSLDKLASYLDQLPILQKVFEKDYNETQINLLKRKGVFPYEYVSSLEKLQDTTLPSIEEFHSSLTDSDISAEDYEHAKREWDCFKISTLGEYSDLYLKTDVLLLAEVFENFRKTCHEAYELDPAHYYTTPGYSWDAMLLYTRVQLELLTDIDMLLFIEKGIRGGVSQCCSRYSEANNRYMGNEYDPTKEDVYLMYYDINNLYGWAMVQSLPYGDFQWDDTPDYLTLPEDSEHGYIFEVDLEYPEEIKVYEIRKPDVYEVMKSDIHEFDTYDYAADNPFQMPRPQENSKKLGLMKDESNSKIMLRFVGLRSKMYRVDIQHGSSIKKIKGVKSSVVKKTITFDDYVECLRENIIISREQHNIRSRLHVLRSEKERKIALSPHDDKRYLVPGTVDTLPWGHKDIASEPPAKKPKYN
uniref:DNA-directed DNA polymerase n=1 Tax=Trichogramma kaykai TaxID=54128 RepID=A0ABD2WZB4_9HYME